MTHILSKIMVYTTAQSALSDVLSDALFIIAAMAIMFICL